MALTIDGISTFGGNYTTGWGSGTGTIPSFITSYNNDLIVVVIGIECTALGHCVVSNVTATGLTFTRRSALYMDGAAGFFGTEYTSLEIWSAQKATSGAVGIITVTWSGLSYDIGDGIAFGVNYDGVSYPVWSKNVSLPATAYLSSGSSYPTVTGIATNTDALVFGFMHTDSIGASQSVGTGMTLIGSNLDNTGSSTNELLIEYKSYTGTGAQSGLSVAGGTSVQTWTAIGDAIETPPLQYNDDYIANMFLFLQI